jgi:hypothetical protein
MRYSACSFGWWLMLIYSERKVLLAYCWFVLREKYCWLVADKPNEQATTKYASSYLAVGFSQFPHLPILV